MCREIVASFWDAMGSNDFSFASSWLHPDFEYYMPQSGEYLKGREAFASLNQTYPSKGTGKWVFDVRSIISDGENAVSDVSVTDGKTSGRAITFHILHNGLILRQKEFWPDAYPAPEWRRHLTKVIDVEPF